MNLEKFETGQGCLMDDGKDVPRIDLGKINPSLRRNEDRVLSPDPIAIMHAHRSEDFRFCANGSAKIY